MNDLPITISVVVCTRNRGASAVAATKSILANEYQGFEVIVIDQSQSLDTRDAIQPYMADGKLRFVRSSTEGLGIARNLGLQYARGAIVAFTDDDCTVPVNWLTVLVDAFQRDPHIAVVFCNVKADEHDCTRGFIPDYERTDNRIVRTLWQKFGARGIGAGLAVRRDLILELGGFDACLGAGSIFCSGEDRDIAIRTLLRGCWVFETCDVAVVHSGFRTWHEGRLLTKRDYYGLGAAYMKLLKCGYINFLPFLAFEMSYMCVWQPLRTIFVHGRIQGAMRIVYFTQGMLQALITPVDREHITFKSKQE